MLNRNFILILISNIILGAPMPMLIILGGLAGGYLSPLPIAATLPPSVQMIAGILVAAPMSLYMGRVGRKKGFLLSAVMIILGGLCGVLALILGSFILLCLAHFLLGGALVGINFFRFASAEAVDEKHKAKAISYTLASGLVAAFIGPEIFSYSKDLLSPVLFAGAYMAVAVLGLIGLLPVLAIGQLVAVSTLAKGQASKDVRKALFCRPVVIFAIAAAAVSQAVMLLIMTPTALAMVGCGFAEDQAADVIKWHVVAMFAPGFFTGSLIQRFGVSKIIATGMTILAGSAMVAIAGIELTHFYASLILLGIGWNFGFIGATHLLQTSLSAEEKPLVQGTNDTILAIAGSVASLASGALYVGIGWTAIAICVLPVIAVSMMLWFVVAQKVQLQA